MPRKGLDKEVFGAKLGWLKHDVTLGIGSLRNKHLLAINLKPERQTTPSAANAVDHFFDYAVAIVRVLLPEYFYRAWVACRLVPANKLSPDNLLPGMTPDCRPGEHRRGQAEARHEGLF